MSRSDLLAQLEDEASRGWPEPWWPQDAASRLPWDSPAYCPEMLNRYIALLADAHSEARAQSSVAPEKKRHLRRAA